MSGTTWTVPSDWNVVNNTIELIGGGGGGGGGAGARSTANNAWYGSGGGGGGGGYTKVTNVSLIPAPPSRMQSARAGPGGTKGAAATSGTVGTAGGTTSFSSYTAAGGGGGGAGYRVTTSAHPHSKASLALSPPLFLHLSAQIVQISSIVLGSAVASLSQFWIVLRLTPRRLAISFWVSPKLSRHFRNSTEFIPTSTLEANI